MRNMHVIRAYLCKTKGWFIYDDTLILIMMKAYTIRCLFTV